MRNLRMWYMSAGECGDWSGALIAPIYRHTLEVDAEANEAADAEPDVEADAEEDVGSRTHLIKGGQCACRPRAGRHAQKRSAVVHQSKCCSKLLLCEIILINKT
jgi:hypothetical protein